MNEETGVEQSMNNQTAPGNMMAGMNFGDDDEFDEDKAETANDITVTQEIPVNTFDFGSGEDPFGDDFEEPVGETVNDLAFDDDDFEENGREDVGDLI